MFVDIKLQKVNKILIQFKVFGVKIKKKKEGFIMKVLNAIGIFLKGIAVPAVKIVLVLAAGYILSTLATRLITKT
jgi:hypothetical protein